MFKRILVANRGEIALRIIRCCREMNIESVLIYSDADRESLPVKRADYAICIGPAAAAKSYLNQDMIIDIAKRMECEAVHPGYGFLSESSEFARKCENAGLTFIGPSADIIDAMGDKQSARSLMMKNNVPTVPGSKGLVKDAKEAKELAAKIGYPVLLKATAGGGGRGMRRVFKEEDLEELFNAASLEAKTAFGNGGMYLEKLILNPKHIEFQIIADKHGNVVTLGDRDCSVQRRNQKMLEESPSKALSEELRKEMGEAAVRAAKACNYYSAGTVEFVLAPDNKYYFIEMNTRIQVEHPVTEMVSSVDLMREQIKVAYGMKLSFTQEDIKLKGHAIECRINAEDPLNNFAPCPGHIGFMHLPGGNGVRVDTAIYSGSDISPFYDSMVAKVIVHGNTRLEAIYKMRAALEELIVEGVKTNRWLQYFLMYNKDFVRGNYTTAFLDANLDDLLEWEKTIEND